MDVMGSGVKENVGFLPKIRLERVESLSFYIAISGGPKDTRTSL